MYYADGHKMLVGDKVKVWEGCYGTVVCSIDDDEYTEKFPKAEWSYLKMGVLIESDQAGLIHYPKMSESLQLIERKQRA